LRRELRIWGLLAIFQNMGSMDMLVFPLYVQRFLIVAACH
jgi:hypothetical protein